MKDINSKPQKIEDAEYYYKGCFIQKQDHPKLVNRYVVFKDTEEQETVGTCDYFAEAKELCEKNEVKNPHYGLKNFLFG